MVIIRPVLIVKSNINYRHNIGLSVFFNTVKRQAQYKCDYIYSVV